MSVTRIFCFVLGIGLLAAPLAHAQRGGPGGGGFGGGGSPISNEAVQKELELSQEQIDKLKIITEESRKTMSDLYGGQRPSDDAARTAIREKMTAAAKEITSKVEGVLTPEQKKRLKEITLQTQGTRALVSDEELIKALNITEEQKKKIEEIRTANRPSFGGGNGGKGGQPGGGGAGGFERFQEQQKETDAKIMDVLTAEQKVSYETMKGKKFDMPRPTFGQGGAGGTRPGGTRPGGNGGTPPGGGDAPKAPSRPEPEL